MLRTIVTTLILAGVAQAAPAAAAGIKVAVVAPVEGPFALLGKQIVDGAAFKAGDHGSEIVVIPETCDTAGNEALTKALLASGAEAAIGFLCTESLDATLPALAEAGLPAITLSVRSDILMEDALKNKWPLFRLAPSGNAEAAAVVDAILDRWKGKPIALVDDGTIHSRELVETVRSALGEIGMTPVFSDTYRPAQEQQINLVRRLVKSGATHVFTGGDRQDTAVIARDALAEGASLALLGGDALNAADLTVPLADGVLAVTLPDASQSPEGKPFADDMRAAGLEPEGYVMPAFAAMALLEQAKDRAAEDDKSLAEAIAKGPYPTVLGLTAFNDKHERAENPYRLMQWQGSRFVPAAAEGRAP
ncbi:MULTISPECIES: branched-chain amino acid ABC transporter substrate-binding protein [unclassified Ensifer]|uniref:branched-chain amino acid ABC transporter substrate-binding protein n=1 Tax=unclassified Ensifer TaxID=2633371 RepID=UPI0008137D35|nr:MULTISPECIES: branched-chain amino acid ABC transporter substrate-binding protein [unclassified Ensifer]OCP03899.1 amino acid ABC transporter [Ensifer sp. LC11]OCP04339.1 amino acid ABC transporter [Ensifer sp. LC13]OCP08496.1 amino acid ABC transporter [Ensifer sp. LC14]OCP30420.1 amino acid ABC transporter [Ensifer sp. LC499]